MEESREMQLESAQPESMGPAPSWYQQLSFDEAKAIIRENIASASRSFIAVGYYLKYIRDQELYKESGLVSIWEFAQEEYGISKSTASRYMTMNDRFSKEGNSPYIKDEYKSFGKSQLQEMLYLNDEQMEQVTPETQVKQIRELRQPAREIPYFDLPGQLSIDDFPDVMPEPATYPEQPAASSGSAVLSVEEFKGKGKWVFQAGEIEQHIWNYNGRDWHLEHPETEPEETTASEPSADEIVVDTNTCPPDNENCRRQEWGTSPEEQKAGHKECVKCWEDWKKLQVAIRGTVSEPAEEAEAPILESESGEIEARSSEAKGRKYTYDDVLAEIEDHEKTMAVFLESGLEAPIVKLTQMRMDAMLLLKAQMEKEADEEDCTEEQYYDEL